MENLRRHLDEASRTPVLLVATDFDGTLAPLVNEPGDAKPHRESIVALEALAAMPRTHVAVISGRSLADLAKRLPNIDRAHLVGSHGSEFEATFATPILPQSISLLAGVSKEAERLASLTPGTMVEKKPAGIAFHYRNANQEQAATAVKMFLETMANRPGIYVRHGKMVVELSVLQTNKGHALQSLRQCVGATTVVCIGDDATDEDAFAVLSGTDVGIKVGPGLTAAKHRVDTTLDVARLLAEIADQRAAWLACDNAVPIEQH